MTGIGCAHCVAFTQQLEELKAENQRLRNALGQCAPVTDEKHPATTTAGPVATEDSTSYSSLSRHEMQRYSRQMLVPDFRMTRQLQLRSARVLIIGAGGLGCPTALYLSGMGVGWLGLVDNDRVERSNLHRQIGHDESTLGLFKVESLARRVRLLNPDVMVETHAIRFTSANAEELVCGYDLVVDASDNPTTRYLVNDVCAKQHKPLVSGSALGLEGQVTVFTYVDSTPCYLCLYPTAPKQPQSCEENGVLGIVPGIIGCLQALETVKVLTNMGTSLSGIQILFDAYDTQFRRLKLTQQRRSDCASCGDHAIHDSYDVGSCADEDALALGSEYCLDIAQFDRIRRGLGISRYVLLDTRAPHQFEMVHFPEAINVPFDQLRRAHLNGELQQFVSSKIPNDEDLQTLVICRRGIDSVLVTSWLVADGWTNVLNVEGGYTRYADVHKDFPMY